MHQPSPPPASRSSTAFTAICGALAAAAAQLNWLASYQPRYDGEPLQQMALVRLGTALVLGPLAILVVRKLLRGAVFAASVLPAAKERYFRRDHGTYTVGLLACLGAIGLRMGGEITALIVGLFVLSQGWLLLAPVADSAGDRRSLVTLSLLFMVSGFAALIYQVAWQRALFTAFGVNIESITVVVSLFMFGLGVGAMVGGHLSTRFPDRLPLLFLAAEVGIAAFGFASLSLIAAVSQVAVHGSLPVITVTIYALLALPTLCMGATLPILVAHLNATYGHIGKSVGLLYFVNTIGSALACWMTTDILFVIGGLQLAVSFAALCNVAVGVSVYWFMVRGRAAEAVTA